MLQHGQNSLEIFSVNLTSFIIFLMEKHGKAKADMIHLSVNSAPVFRGISGSNRTMFNSSGHSSFFDVQVHETVPELLLGPGKFSVKFFVLTLTESGKIHETKVLCQI